MREPPRSDPLSVPLRGEDRPLSTEAVRLVAMDLDGTLLRSDHSICVHAAQAIADATARGVKIVIATGRAPRSAARIGAALGLDTVQVCHNGAAVVEPGSGRVLWQQTMPPAIARRVVQIARDISAELAIGVEIGDRCYTDRRGREKLAADPAIRGGTKNGAPGGEAGVGVAAVRAVGDDDPICGVMTEPVSKVMFLGEPQALVEVELRLRQRLGTQVGFGFSHMRLMQVVAGGVDKAAALERVAQQYRVSRAEVMAIGDAPNDTGMIRWAGVGVAVGNAWEEVKREAHFVMPSNDDAGVAAALRRFVV